MENSKQTKPQNRRKSKGKPNFRKNNTKTESVDKVKSYSHNDAAWYTTDGQVVSDVASFSFNAALGTPVVLQNNLPIGAQWLNLPGIATIYTMPTIGVSGTSTQPDPNSPANIAARRLYSNVRHANSGHSNYDPADLMLYLLAIDSIYTYWSWMVRAYGTAQYYSRVNKYTGDLYLSAMGFEPNSLRHNLADFRAYINLFAKRANSFCVPKVMTYFLRHSWMYSNIYKDEDTDRAQVYMYVPAGVYKYNATISAGTGGLEVVPLTVDKVSGQRYLAPNTVPMSISNVMAIGNNLINAMADQEDIGIISGDILKAYGDLNLWRLESIAEDYTVIPVFSEEVLAQIHNSMFAGRTPIGSDGTAQGLATFNVFQDVNVGGGTLFQDLYFEVSSHLCNDTIVDFWKQNVSPEDVMVASRNMLTGEPVTIEGIIRPSRLTSCGSEVPLFMSIYRINADSTVTVTNTYLTDASVPDVYQCGKFNEFPTRWVATNTGGYAGFYGEVDNYAYLSRQNVANMHEVALMSMFGVPYLK